MTDRLPLAVSVLNGTDLCDKPTQVFCQVTILDKEGKIVGKPQKTSVKKETNPQWNETLNFFLPLNSFQGLVLRVWKKRRVLSDQLLSQVTIKFNQKLLEQTEVLEETFPLTKKSKKKGNQDETAGKIRVKVQYGKVGEEAKNKDESEEKETKKDTLRVSRAYGDKQTDKQLEKKTFVVVPEDDEDEDVDESGSEDESDNEEQKDVPLLDIKVSEYNETDPQTVVELNSETSQKEESDEIISQSPPQMLSQDRVTQIFTRVTPIKTEETDQKEFHIRESTVKTPKTGDRIDVPFPPPPEVVPEVELDLSKLEKLSQQETGALEVERYSPEGEQKNPVTTLSITFNQPMIEVTSLKEIKEMMKDENPVILTPQPPGKWVWKGTQTLQFEAEGRFPFATQYKVTVKEGTKSKFGSVLKKAFSFSFITNPPRVIHCFPYNEAIVRTLKPFFFLAFDQRIDPKKMLSHIRVEGGSYNGKPILLSEDATKKLIKKEMKSFVFNEGTYVAWKMDTELPKNTRFTITVGPNIPSAEGPYTDSYTFSTFFSTYPPFKIAHRITWKYQPGSPFILYFTNPIDVSTCEKSLFTWDKTPGTVTYIPQESQIIINNQSKANSKYTLTVNRKLKDVYGQSLEGDNTVTFTTDAGFGSLSGTNGIVLLDPSSPPIYAPIVSGYTELHVEIWQVNPTDYWRSIVAQGIDYKQPEKNVVGKKVLDKVMTLDTEGGPSSVQIDLRSSLQYPEEGLGQLIVKVEPTEKTWKVFHHFGQYNDYHEIVCAWVQCTKMSLDLFWSQRDISLLAWVSSLFDGKPVNDVKISAPDVSGVTNNDGLVQLQKIRNVSKAVIIGVKDHDIVFAPVYNIYQIDWDRYAWFVIDDRKLYRPKEEVHLKGYVRRLKRDGDKIVPEFASGNVSYTVTDAQSVMITKGELKLSEYGAFSLKISLPDNMNLGTASVSFVHGSHSNHTHSFRVEEFRKPEFEVSSSYRPQRNHVATLKGDFVVVTAKASYFSGGALSDSEVNWKITQQVTDYQPPGWSNFTFGIFKPWWIHISKFPFSGRSSSPLPSSEPSDKMVQFQGKTDSNGEHSVKLMYSGRLQDPVTVNCAAVIRDLTNQALQTTSNFIVHPCSLYVGISTKKSYGKPKEIIPFDVIVCNIDGEPVEGVEIEVNSILSWTEPVENDKGIAKWEKKNMEEQKKLISKKEPIKYEYTPQRGGIVKLTFKIKDKEGLVHRSQMHLRIVGSSQQQMAKTQKVTQDTLTLIPSKKEYNPSEDKEGEVFIQSPFAPCEGLLTLQCEGLVFNKRFRMTENSTTVTFPIKEDWLPNVTLQVDVFGQQPRIKDNGEVDKDSPPRPAFAEGEINLSISRQSKKLCVDIIPQKSKVKPGESIAVDVRVKDQKGNPVSGCEVCLIAVDESVLALTGYSIPDPLPIFYPNRSSGVISSFLRSFVLLLSSEDFNKLPPRYSTYQDVEEEESFPLCTESLVVGLSARSGESQRQFSLAAVPRGIPQSTSLEGGSSTPIEVRTNFSSIALFEPSLITDKEGRVSSSMKIPDSLTKFRIWAIASTSTLYGLGENKITVQLPLAVRPQATRFLNFGDKAKFTVVIQNQTDERKTVDVAMRCSNLVFSENFTGGYQVQIEALGRAKVLFPVETVMSGTARIQVVVVSSDFSDAAELSFPVYTPATTEAFATYGDISEKTVVFQPIKVPSGVYKQFGGLEVSVSSTILMALTDAVLYLYNYDFECCEQLASRVLGIVALKDVLSAFKVKDLPSSLTIMLKLEHDMKELKKCQYPDGGFSFWKPTNKSWDYPNPFISAHVTNCIAKCIEKGISIDSTVKSKAHTFIQNMENFLNRHYSWLSEVTRNSLLAFCLYVRHKLKEKVANLANQLFERCGVAKFSLEALGWLLIAMSSTPNERKNMDIILNYLKNQVNETAETANFITSYGDEGKFVMLHSDRRTDAVLLESLLTVDSKNTLIPKLAKGLLAHKKRGRWNNTQENCFILVALDEYFRVYEKDEPNYIARMWFGENFVSEQKWEGRSTDTLTVNIPMDFILKKGDSPLVMQKEGKGRMYYRLGMNYAPENLKLKAAQCGFKVTRRYEGVDKSEHARQDSDGVWHFKVGEKIRVIIDMTTTSRRYHVVLVDKLPAGLEILNTKLLGTETVTTQEEWSFFDSSNQQNFNPLKYRMYHRYRWYDHENLRDERAEVFKSLLWEGHYTYIYTCRATSAGSFVVPPAKAEEMYSPEVFGRSASDRVIIEP